MSTSHNNPNNSCEKDLEISDIMILIISLGFQSRSWCTTPLNQYNGRAVIFLEGGKENVDQNCLQGLKRQNKLLANMICIKYSFHRVQKTFNLLKKTKAFKTEN